MYQSSDALWRYIGAVAKEAVGAINSSEVGKIRAVNKNLVDVWLVNMQMEVKDIPIFTLQGGGSFIQFPIKEGDECLIVFSKYNNDAWYEGKEFSPNPTFDISNGICLVGVNKHEDALEVKDYTELLIEKIKIHNGSEDLVALVSDMMELLTTVIDTNSTMASDISAITTIIASGSSAGTYPINPADVAKFTAHNASYSGYKSELEGIQTKYDKMKVD